MRNDISVIATKNVCLTLRWRTLGQRDPCILFTFCDALSMW